MFDKSQKRILILLSFIFVALLSICIYIYQHRETLKTEPFVKPTFDSHMIKGTPAVFIPDWNYSPLELQPGKKISLCATPIVTKKSLQLYLTSDKSNDFWLRVRVLDKKKQILGECGLIEPGSYIKNIPLKKNIKAGKKIILYLMMYETGTYQGAGSAAIEITVGG